MLFSPYACFFLLRDKSLVFPWILCFSPNPYTNLYFCIKLDLLKCSVEEITLFLCSAAWEITGPSSLPKSVLRLWEGCQRNSTFPLSWALPLKLVSHDSLVTCMMWQVSTLQKLEQGSVVMQSKSIKARKINISISSINISIVLVST